MLLFARMQSRAQGEMKEGVQESRNPPILRLENTSCTKTEERTPHKKSLASPFALSSTLGTQV
jgi:hypothetical protein